MKEEKGGKKSSSILERRNDGIFCFRDGWMGRKVTGRERVIGFVWELSSGFSGQRGR